MLERLARRAAAAEAVATAVRQELVQAARVAHAEGASLRAIGEVVALPRRTVFDLVSPERP